MHRSITSSLFTVALLTAMAAPLAVSAQPGYYSATFRISELDSPIAFKGRVDPRLFRYTYLVDSLNGDHRNFGLLDGHSKLMFSFETPAIPAAFGERVLDSLNHVTIQGNDTLRDLEHIGGFATAREIRITGFVGRALPAALAEYRRLNAFKLAFNPTVEDADVLAELDSLEYLALDCTRLKRLPPFQNNRSIRRLSLSNVPPDLDLSPLRQLLHLSELELRLLDTLAEIPHGLNPELRILRVGGHVDDWEGLYAYPKIFALHYKGGRDTSLRIDLSRMPALANLSLRKMPRLRTLDLPPGSTLDYLSLRNLPQLSVLDLTAITLREALSIHHTGVRSIKPTDTLIGLKSLRLADNPHLDLSLVEHKGHTYFMRNGRLVEKRD